MYICIYVYMYICIYVYMYICVHLYTYVHIYISTYTHTYMQDCVLTVGDWACDKCSFNSLREKRKKNRKKIAC